MARRTIHRFAILGTTLAIVGLFYLTGHIDRSDDAGLDLILSAVAQDQAQSGITPTGQLRDPNIFYPGTEEIAPDEMRLFACGTGMPTARESQAASCWLLELGNGDKFIFDGGTGSAARIASMGIPYDFLNKMFFSHLHTDHFGDFAAYFIGGWVAGRQGPLHVYGPSGARPETGTKYAIEHFEKALTWDIEGRAGRLPASGGKVIIHEFDFKAENAGHLSGEWCDHPFMARQSHHRRARQLQSRMERAEVRVRRRHLSEQVVRQVCEGC